MGRTAAWRNEAALSVAPEAKTLSKFYIRF
jgi:hypothetical protein